jgi:hypothetical protein
MAWVEQRGGGYRVRLRLPDGTVVTDSTHPTKPTAQLRAKEIDVELGKDTFLDPRDGRITLTEWVKIWQSTHQAGPATWSAYRSHLRLHILPRLGHLPLTALRRQHIKALIIDLKTKLAPRSTADVITVLSLVLGEAVEDRRIPHNPCRNLRVDPGTRSERPHAAPTQVTAIAGRIRRRVDQVMVITAAYTGMRWGELAGLSRDNIDLDAASIYVHPRRRRPARSRRETVPRPAQDTGLGAPHPAVPVPRRSSHRDPELPLPPGSVLRRPGRIPTPIQLQPPGMDPGRGRRPTTRHPTHPHRHALPRPAPHPQDLWPCEPELAPV